MLKTLALTNFRSYAADEFGFGPGVTLVVGPNASGKTNLLEAVYVLAATKSFRAADADLARYNQDFFRVAADFNQDQIALAWTHQDGATRKQITHNGVKKSLAGHIGQIQVVLFEPTDLDLISGPPELRRRYLDFVLCQTDRTYLAHLNTYRRLLRQRNRLLESFNIGAVKDQIFAWDLKLAAAAADIFNRRQALLGFINEIISELYGQIAGQAQTLELDYLPSVKPAGYGDNFLHALAANLTRDLAAGFTTIGPHREDFKVRFKNNDMAAVASRGELRTAVLAMKLAELAYGERASGQLPLLLLDDVFSELDAQRRRYLLKKLRGHQTIITTTNADAIGPTLKDAAVISTAKRKIYARR